MAACFLGVWQSFWPPPLLDQGPAQHDPSHKQQSASATHKMRSSGACCPRMLELQGMLRFFFGGRCCRESEKKLLNFSNEKLKNHGKVLMGFPQLVAQLLTQSTTRQSS